MQDLLDLQSITFVSTNSLSRMMELTSMTSMDWMLLSAKTLQWRLMTSHLESIELILQHYSTIQLKVHLGTINQR